MFQFKRPSCDEALSHPWLTDRQNLEERAAERKRKSSLVFSQENGEEWSMGQQVAFIVSVLVILGMVSNEKSIFNCKKFWSLALMHRNAESCNLT